MYSLFDGHRCALHGVGGAEDGSYLGKGQAVMAGSPVNFLSTPSSQVLPSGHRCRTCERETQDSEKEPLRSVCCKYFGYSSLFLQVRTSENWHL